MLEIAQSFVAQINGGKPLNEEQAMQILTSSGAQLTAFMAGAQGLKEQHLGEKIGSCAIVNAKSGHCAENCSFCAQSSHNKTKITTYPLKSTDAILHDARAAERQGSQCFSIVTSGTRIEPGQEFEQLLATIRTLRQQTAITISASIGILDQESANALKAAGCSTYHHNLETSRSFFPEICTTHSYDDDIATVRFAQEAGMDVCCGGIFGLGESLEQRIEMGMLLQQLDVDSVPINFLNPVPGTPLAGKALLSPKDCLRIICLYRYLLPTKNITVCGGRDVNMRDLQAAIFMAGASSMMIGNYLTTAGRKLQTDQQMLADSVS